MKPQPPGEADWRRRHALGMAGQLPENVTDALAILDFMRELVAWAKAGTPEPVKAPPAPVVTLVRSQPEGEDWRCAMWRMSGVEVVIFIAVIVVAVALLMLLA